MAITSAIFDSSCSGNQSTNINHIASQGKGSLLDGGVLVKVDTLTNTIALNYGITGSQSDKLSSGYSVKLLTQSSAKVSAGQSAKYFAGLKYETLSYPNPDIPNRGGITPFKGFPVVTTRGGIEYCQPINDRRVEFCESIKKGSVSATLCVFDIKYRANQYGNSSLDLRYSKYQPFGSIPRRSNSFRPSVLSQLAKLIFDCFAVASNCAFKSGAMRIWNGGAFPVPFGCLSRLMTVDMCTPINVVLFLIGVHTNMCVPIKTMPRSASTLTGHLTTNDIISIEVAMNKHITPVTGRNSLTPNQSFRWLFLALERGNPAAKPHRIEATAPNEHSARLLLVRDYILAFAGRVPVREVAA